MLDVGKEFKEAFLTMLNAMGSHVTLYHDYYCDKDISIKLKALKNSPRGNSSITMFQLPEIIDVKVGAILQQENSSVIWEVYKTEEHIISDTVIDFKLFVRQLDVAKN